MNIPTIATKTNVIFLTFISITGTIVAIFPSYITEVQALSEYEMNKYNSKYLSYEKDDLKTTNFDLSVNGLNFNTILEPINGLAAEVLAEESQIEITDIDTNTFGNWEKRFGFDKDFVYKYITNNDNEQIGIGSDDEEDDNGGYNGNPTIDLVSANVNFNTVSILLGNGDGTFG